MDKNGNLTIQEQNHHNLLAQNRLMRAGVNDNQTDAIVNLDPPKRDVHFQLGAREMQSVFMLREALLPATGSMRTIVMCPGGAAPAGLLRR